MSERRLGISIARQQLRLWQDGVEQAVYSVSTARNGAGELNGSGCTPRGLHRIRLKIGSGCPEGAVFVARRFTGEIYSEQLKAEQPQRDWILSRIIWLSGCEVGKNRGGECDTLRRFIYIHGTPDSEPMGEPLSHGCVRMRNRDIIDLFERIAVGDTVEIEE